ncbi:MAG TPA: GDSL-type esterase/lipase family protein [Opitutales bacterium]|jgi:lysophospholipase L1-like esterase|nr:GDSL-type esterase/lipase family protein [Opitutales bacterium]
MNKKSLFTLSAAISGGILATLTAQTAPAPAAASAIPTQPATPATSVPAAGTDPKNQILTTAETLNVGGAPSTAPAATTAPARAARAAPSQKVAGIQAISTTSSYKFYFGTGDAPAGYTKITADMAYNDARGYGFDGNTTASIITKKIDGKPDVNIATTDKLFFFSTALPEGNYKVTVTMGNPDVATDVSALAELRRLMLENVQTKPGEYVTKTFTVNIRTPQYPNGAVNLKAPRESTDEAWDWDKGLTLEFIGDHPSISDLRIEKVDVPTVYVVGDSTSCDQVVEPYNSWGQTITRFLKADVAVANLGESGETIGDNLGRHRFDKIYSLMKPGDYIFITSGHNEKNGKNGNMTFDQAFYDDYKQIVGKSRALGGLPVLVTPISRAPGSASLGPYPGELQKLATDENVPIIDLNASSATFYRAVPDYHAVFATRSEATHNNDYGSYEVSKMLITGIRQLKLPLAKSIVDDFTDFDPAKPDALESFKVVPTPKPGAPIDKPAGS